MPNFGTTIIITILYYIGYVILRNIKVNDGYHSSKFNKKM